MYLEKTKERVEEEAERLGRRLLHSSRPEMTDLGQGGSVGGSEKQAEDEVNRIC